MTDRLLNILVAYPYVKNPLLDIIKEREAEIRFLLDSGAFTAWKAGKPIALDDYCRFVESLPVKPWKYFSLDVIGNPKETRKNYETMLQRGFNPIPIFTRGEDISVLEDYYKTSDIVAIGGLVGTLGNKGFVKGIMQKVGERKCHWLGFNAREFIHNYRPYMCDSSSWCSALRFASMKLYQDRGRWIHVHKQDFRTRPSDEILKLLQLYHIEPARFANKSEWKNSGRGDYVIEEATCKSWVRYQIDLSKKLNVNFFLACASNWQVKLMHDAFKFWSDKI